jgi:hypothetical protein
MIPNVGASTLAQAKQVWDEAIDKFGSDVVLKNQDETTEVTVKAFAKRPKIMGLFDRTQASVDQERYVLLIKYADCPDPEKFMRAYWDGQDHIFISVTRVELANTVFGYRIMVKG